MEAVEEQERAQRQIGEVDEGSTVMDYLEVEGDREFLARLAHDRDWREQIEKGRAYLRR